MAQKLPLIGEQETEVLNAQTHIWNNMFSFVKSNSLRCAVELDIPDIIHKHGRPMTLYELADAISINRAKSDQLRSLMRALVHFGFFVEAEIPESEGRDGYALTPASNLLHKDNPLSLRPYVLGMLHPFLAQPWNHASEWFRNDDATTFDTAYGMKVWEYTDREPKLNRLVNDAMASQSLVGMSVLIKYGKGVFEGLNSLVDVGGGNGSAAKTIAENFPDLKCTVFDLPHVVQGLEGTNNLDYVGGDMFVSIPHAHAILLKAVLHNCSDEESVKLLKKCKESIYSKEKGGKIIIIEMVIDNEKNENKSLETKIFLDMIMMIQLNGKERSEKEWAKLFGEAGFSDYKIVPILGLMSIIEVYP